MDALSIRGVKCSGPKLVMVMYWSHTLTLKLGVVVLAVRRLVITVPDIQDTAIQDLFNSEIKHHLWTEIQGLGYKIAEKKELNIQQRAGIKERESQIEALMVHRKLMQDELERRGGR